VSTVNDRFLTPAATDNGGTAIAEIKGNCSANSSTCTGDNSDSSRKPE
jgi:hypothetical protein